MPTIGEAGYRYPSSGVRPDVPLHLQQLAQDVARVTDSVATVADLPVVDNWAGRVKVVRSTSGAFWQWNGATWSMHGVANFANAAARSAAIPSPTAGMRSFLDDTQMDYRHDGTGWQIHATIGPWKTYAATLTGFNPGTGGGVKNVTEWRREGDLIRVRYVFTFGTSGQTFPTTPKFSLPVVGTPVGHDYQFYAGVSDLLDVSITGVRKGNVVADVNSASVVRLTYDMFTGGGYDYPTPTVPWTWAAGDSMQGEFTYRPAA